jgi:hypothetical protein
LIAARGSGRSTSVIPDVPAAWSVTTIAFTGRVPYQPCFVLDGHLSPLISRLAAKRAESRNQPLMAGAAFYVGHLPRMNQT